MFFVKKVVWLMDLEFENWFFPRNCLAQYLLFLMPSGFVVWRRQKGLTAWLHWTLILITSIPFHLFPGKWASVPDNTEGVLQDLNAWTWVTRFIVGVCLRIMPLRPNMLNCSTTRLTGGSDWLGLLEGPGPRECFSSKVPNWCIYRSSMGKIVQGAGTGL